MIAANFIKLLDPQVVALVTVLVNISVALLLYIWRRSISEIKLDIQDVKRLNDSRHTEAVKITRDIEREVHELDKRVTLMELTNKGQTKLIDEMHLDIKEVIKEVRDMRTSYDNNIREFFEKYDLKQK